MNHPKTQHYVPRFLLRGFTGAEGQVHVFDKWEDRTFQTGPGNVAAENGFYDLEVEGGILTLEGRLSNLEGHASGVIRKIRDSEAITDLTATERGTLAIFTAVQHLRTAEFRQKAKDLDGQVRDWLAGMGVDPGEVEGYTPLMDETDVKDFTMRFMVDATQEIAEHLTQKDWILTKAPDDHPFQIGDHPVTLSNEREFGFYGNIGFGVPGIEIYLPISSRLSLYFTCRSNGDKIRKAWADVQPLKAAAPDHPEVRELAARVEANYESLQNGTARLASPENVVRHNSLQISQSERWIYSSTDDFSLVRRMIDDNPRFRRGGRLSIGGPSQPVQEE